MRQPFRIRKKRSTEKKYAIKTAGTTWQVAKNFSSAGITFTARLDNNVVTGVKLTDASGGVNAVTIDKSGNIYVNNVKTVSVEASDKYSFELNLSPICLLLR